MRLYAWNTYKRGRRGDARRRRFADELNSQCKPFLAVQEAAGWDEGHVPG